MEKMKGKTLLCLTLVTLMLLSVFMIGPVSAPSTTIGVEPDWIVDPGLGPGSTFTVEIWVRDVADLAGLEFHLGYDTTVLTATLIEYGDIFGATYFPLISEINDTEGYLHYSIMEMFGEPGFYGDGRAAIINFTVDSVGASALDLYDTKLGDSSAPPVPIVHEALDGYFYTPPPSVTLARRSAWPEHHNYEVLWDEDASNDLFAIASNNGDVDTWIKVVFTVTGPTGIPTFVETPTVPLAAGALAGKVKPYNLKAAFMLDITMLAKYYVSAQCWADTDGDAVPDTAMGKIKTFSFRVVLELPN